MQDPKHYDVIIVGAGPAGLTAGIYLSRARLRALILTDGTVGGQMVLTHEIANYPGVESINGYQLASIMRKQAKSFGCEIRSNIKVAGLSLEGPVKSATLGNGETFTADALILTPGGRPRTLGVDGETAFKGKGISYCATCDGDFFTGKEVVVVGGGNSALEEAVSLTKYASKVTIVHQFDHFQAFPYAVEEARANEKIRFIMRSVIEGFHGGENLESVRIRNLDTDAVIEYPTDGVFIFIGYLPNTNFLEGQIAMNDKGEILVDPATMETRTDGVFAAGDCIVKKYRQVTTAVGEGTVAALSAAEYIRQQQTERERALPALEEVEQ